jgi:hypothetical protein
MAAAAAKTACRAAIFVAMFCVTCQEQAWSLAQHSDARLFWTGCPKCPSLAHSRGSQHHGVTSLEAPSDRSAFSLLWHAQRRVQQNVQAICLLQFHQHVLYLCARYYVHAVLVDCCVMSNMLLTCELAPFSGHHCRQLLKSAVPFPPHPAKAVISLSIPGYMRQHASKGRASTA